MSLSPAPLPSYWTLDGDLLQFARAHTHTHARAHTQENLASQRVSLMPLISQPQRLCGLSPSPHTAARLHGSRIPRLPVLLPPPGHHLPSFQLFKPCPLLRVQPGGFASTVRLSWGPSAPLLTFPWCLLLTGPSATRGIHVRREPCCGQSLGCNNGSDVPSMKDWQKTTQESQPGRPWGSSG